MSSKTLNDYTSKLLDEVRKVGASAERVTGRRHAGLAITYNGVTRKLWFPKTPRDNRTGPRNSVQDLRRMLRELGAIS